MTAPRPPGAPGRGADGPTGGELAATAAAAVLLAITGAALLAPLGLVAWPLVGALAFVVPSLALARRHGGPRAVLGLAPPPPRALVGAVLVGASLWLLILLALGPLHAYLPDRGATEQRLAILLDRDLSLPLRVALFALVPAIGEELLCRGVLCRHLARRYGAARGLAASTLYFAALHFSWTQGSAALITGLACGAVALWSGSTLTSMALHATNNAVLIVVAAPELGLAARIEQPPVFLGLAGLAVVATGLGLRTVRSSMPSRGSLP